jgi:hypothetical protein
MDQRIKKEWVDALRSGTYEQGFGSLRKDGKYCCLGVLCAVIGHIPLFPEEDFGIDDSLPPMVAKQVGLGSTNPEVILGVLPTPLSVLNDDGVPFDEIAKLIEAQL